MSKTKKEQAWFVFDVESIGLHGEAFAVAGGIYVEGEEIAAFCVACYPGSAEGNLEDRLWIETNVPPIHANAKSPEDVRNQFWTIWECAKEQHPGILMAAECGWPVEARFLAACVDDDPQPRRWAGPYPLHDVASFMLAAGMDPMATYERNENELPAHNPLVDVRLSARLLFRALDQTRPWDR